MRNSNEERDFNHFIITRCGLGQTKDDFFQVNLAFLENTLYPSLLAQTNKAFKWLLLIDIRAPEWVFRKLDEMMARLPEAEYVLHDPFDNLKVMPDINDVLASRGINTGEYLVTTRVDSDDALNINYVEEVNSRTTDFLNVYGRKPISINPVNGVYYYPATGDFVSVYKDNYSVQSVGSVFGHSFWHCHSVGHTRMSSTFKRNGLHAAFINTGKQMWMRSIRKDSNTRKGRAVESREINYIFMKRLNQIRNRITGKSTPTKYLKKLKSVDVFQLFAFSKERQATLYCIERELEVNIGNSPDSGELPKAWAYKKSVLREYAQAIENQNLSKMDFHKRRDELITRYYAR